MSSLLVWYLEQKPGEVSEGVLSEVAVVAAAALAHHQAQELHLLRVSLRAVDPRVPNLSHRLARNRSQVHTRAYG
eukprot:COSAG05_NODE_63_length_22889_cov_41.986617_7_plen_75_part_00